MLVFSRVLNTNILYRKVNLQRGIVENKNVKVYENDNKSHIHYTIKKLLQSGNINFMVGSGASYPAIQVLGNKESEIREAIKNDNPLEAKKITYEFLKTIQEPTNILLEEKSEDEKQVKDNQEVTSSYYTFINVLKQILIDRRTSLLPKQINIFTTNYDLFIEKASEEIPALRVNDGFHRMPSLTNTFKFSVQHFFDETFNSGNLYNYRVQIPVINLIKIHGSLSWHRVEEDIIYRISKIENLPPDPNETQLDEYLKKFAIVLPQSHKFHETVMDRFYYDLLRTYSNELDRENTVLFIFGFSFADEHIYDITIRALKNPTLTVVIFAFCKNNVDDFQAKFKAHKNVIIIAPEDASKINFQVFNSVLSDSIGYSPEETHDNQ